MNDLYSGNARERLYEGTRVGTMSAGVMLPPAEFTPPGELLSYGGGSNAEKQGVRAPIVQALSGVESYCVVLTSYAYENRRVVKVR